MRLIRIIICVILTGCCLIPLMAKVLPSARTSAPITLTIQRCIITTTMDILPRSLQQTPSKTPLPPMSGYVTIVVPLPDFVQQQDLQKDTIKINGNLITPVSPLKNQIPDDWRQFEDSYPKNTVILFFNRQQFVDKLGAIPEVKTVTLEMTIGAGHLLTATGQFTLLPPPKGK